MVGVYVSYMAIHTTNGCTISLDNGLNIRIRGVMALGAVAQMKSVYSCPSIGKGVMAGITGNSSLFIGAKLQHIVGGSSVRCMTIKVRSMATDTLAAGRMRCCAAFQCAVVGRVVAGSATLRIVGLT